MWRGGHGVRTLRRSTQSRGGGVAVAIRIAVLLFITARLSNGDAPRCQPVEPLLRHRPPRGLLVVDYREAMGTVLTPTTIAESPELALAFHAATGRPCVLEVFSMLFRADTSRTAVVRSDWAQRLENATASLEELYNRGVVFALHLGERMLWRNVSLLDYANVADRVKAALPELGLYATEALEVFATGGNANGYRSSIPSLPSSLDYITVTVEREDQFRPEWVRGESADDVIGWQRWAYENFVYPKLNPRQQIVPRLAFSGSSQLSAAQRAELFEALVLWMASDPRVGGATHIPSPEDVPLSDAPCFEGYLASVVDRRSHDVLLESQA